MLKKTIKYEDFNGNEREEDFYFNFSKAEMMELELMHPGGLTEHINRIINTSNQPEIIALFKELILKAYGEKDETGVRFVKSKELSDAFSQTNAYSELFMELASNDEAAAEFVNGIVPKVEEPVSDKPQLPENK